MPNYPSCVEYSDKYYDDTYEYRHVTLPKKDYDNLPHSYQVFYLP